MSAVAENAFTEQRVILTTEAFAEVLNRDEINQQLRLTVEELDRIHAEQLNTLFDRYAGQAARLGNQLPIATEEGHQARLMFEINKNPSRHSTITVSSSHSTTRFSSTNCTSVTCITRPNE